jgi:hypothetical protein
MAEYHGTGMTVGGLHGPFYNTGHVLTLPFWGLGKGHPYKGQGVSIQTLSSNLFNGNERSKAQGAGKRDLFQLTIDEPRWGTRISGWEDSSKIIGETLQS